MPTKTNVRILVDELFHAVVDLSAEDRSRYFIEHKAAFDIRTEVERLIAFDASPTIRLEKKIGQVAEWTLARIERNGLRCGAYELGDLVGRGGMGRVYSAERVDGEVSQRAAVKLLEPGADIPPLRRRFLEERQILANLSHPNVAKLLDAGHREDGQPYLVMEYIEGQPIDVYARALSARQ